MPVPPTATYRLQFMPEFGFRDAIDLVPYLDRLGISHLYASPLLKPAPGSAHGYDVVDPTSLNPELGEEAEFQRLLRELSWRGMGLILDIVPNHMAVNSRNEWWQDVLEHGIRSRYARFFDIDWQRGGGQVVVPTLGDHFGNVLVYGDLKLGIDDRGFAVHYYEHRFPVDPASYAQVLIDVHDQFRQSAGGGSGVVESELEALIALSRELHADAGHHEELHHAAASLGRRTWNLLWSGEVIQSAFDAVIARYNGTSGDAASYDQLERLLNRQQYRLTFWRRASEEINYRRFFDIADLISLRIEDPEVFEAVHALILEYAGAGGIDGFRADHVDGLFDPQGYAERLRRRLAESRDVDAEHLLLFEKILTGDEHLPPDWPIAGTTGYEFAHRVNALLAHPEGFSRIEQHYAELTGLDGGFESIVHANKAKVLDDLFSGQFYGLVDDLFILAQSERESRDLSRRQLLEALREVMVRLPVYRTYVRNGAPEQRDRQILQDTLEISRGALDGIEEPVWTFLGSVLLPNDGAESRIAWVRCWQQFTGPLMAKGLEDTSLYVYTPLTSLNEVGGEPETISVARFHSENKHTADHWPRSMLTTSTHDTKRSEDVRARIGVLSELEGEWLEHLQRWRSENAALRESINGMPAPDANEEQFIYQTLLGAWPLDRAEFPRFRDRVKEYLTKAMREAKVYTSWIAVDEEYERAVLTFVDRIFDADPGGAFFRDFVAFQTRISSYGAWNSLSQLALKLTSPGFPDIYQGNELWDFSLADPDNRRPVDYALRNKLVPQLEQVTTGDVPELLEQWRDGRIKMLVTACALRSRRDQPEPFLSGGYQPLTVEGDNADHVIAFGRHSGGEWAITVVPRHTTGLVPPDTPPIGESIWGATRVLVPPEAPSTWVDIFSGASCEVIEGHCLRVSDLLGHLPVAVVRES